MHMTQDQRYIMAFLEKTQTLYRRQVLRLLQLDKPWKTERHVQTALRQLHYMGKVAFLADELIALPLLQTPEPDEKLLECVDVMLEIIQSKPISIATDKLPFQLCFLVDDANGLAAFAAIYVPFGEERRVSMLIEQAEHEGYSTILLLEDLAQREEIRCASLHHFAVWDGDRHHYYKGGDSG